MKYRLSSSPNNGSTFHCPVVMSPFKLNSCIILLYLFIFVFCDICIPKITHNLPLFVTPSFLSSVMFVVRDNWTRAEQLAKLSGHKPFVNFNSNWSPQTEITGDMEVLHMNNLDRNYGWFNFSLCLYLAELFCCRFKGNGEHLIIFMKYRIYTISTEEIQWENGSI